MSKKWSGTNWIYDWYKSVGIIFEEVHAWEPSKGGGRGKMPSRGSIRNRGHIRSNSKHILQRSPHGRMLQDVSSSFYPEGVLHFYDVGVTDAVGHEHNPLHLIKQKCKPEDFVVFKLDIDSKFEINIVHQLLADPELMTLVDEFYYEHHVRNHVMRMHGLGASSNQKYSLKAWYDMATEARKKGFRMHFWP